MAFTVGLTYDLKSDYLSGAGESKDFNAEFDAPETVNLIVDSLKECGNKVVKIGNAKNLLNNINNLKDSVDIVFNICEGLSGRNREAQVPVILEMWGIPFVGADGLTLSLTLDKVMTKKILIAEGIPTPKYFVINNGEVFSDLDHLAFPLIVKPKYEGSSKGLTENSRVENREQLRHQINCVTSTYYQPALVEEFIQGIEFTVPIIGNNPPKVYSPVQVAIDNDVNLGDRFYTFARIEADNLSYIYPAHISDILKDKLCRLALKTYQAVECCDFGRVDFRVDSRGNPYVLEINPLPCLATADVFTLIAKHENVSYSEVISSILNAAIKRYNLNRDDSLSKRGIPV